MEFTRINNDVNGNPRYVVHFLQCEPDCWKDDSGISSRYACVVKLMNKIGGRKFHNKQYGGGIAFQSYDNEELENRIESLKKQCK